MVDVTGRDDGGGVDESQTRFDDLEFLEALEVEEASYVGPLPKPPAPSRPEAVPPPLPLPPKLDVTLVAPEPLPPPPKLDVTVVAPEPLPPPPKLDVTVVAPEPLPPPPKLDVTVVAPEPHPLAPKLEITLIAPEPLPPPPKLDITVVAPAPIAGPEASLVSESDVPIPLPPSRRATPMSPLALLGSPPQRRLVEVRPTEPPERTSTRITKPQLVLAPEPAAPEPAVPEPIGLALKPIAPEPLPIAPAPGPTATTARMSTVLPLPAEALPDDGLPASPEDSAIEWSPRPWWPWLLVAASTVAAVAVLVPLARSTSTRDENVRAAGLVIDASRLRDAVPEPTLEPSPTAARDTPDTDTDAMLAAASVSTPDAQHRGASLRNTAPDPEAPPRKRRTRAAKPSVLEADAAPAALADASTPEPIATQAPTRSRKPAPTARALLQQSKRALQAGHAEDAYRLAVQSQTRAPSQAALQLIARAGCRAEHKQEARNAVRRLPLRERISTRRDCRKSGHRLGL